MSGLTLRLLCDTSADDFDVAAQTRTALAKTWTAPAGIRGEID